MLKQSAEMSESSKIDVITFVFCKDNENSAQPKAGFVVRLLSYAGTRGWGRDCLRVTNQIYLVPSMANKVVQHRLGCSAAPRSQRMCSVYAPNSVLATVHSSTSRRSVHTWTVTHSHSMRLSHVATRAHTRSAGELQLPLRKRVLAVVKPSIYAVAWVPVLVGCACAFHDTGVLPVVKAAQLVAASCCVIAWLNLSNDAWDDETGVDENKWESAVALLGSRWRVHAVAWPLLGVALWMFASAAAEPRVLGLLASALVCGHAYQAPPLRLSYKGLGEPLCFVAFGPLATCAFRIAAAPSTDGVNAAQGNVWSPLHSIMSTDVSSLCVACSLLIGATTTVILFCSHMHQVDGDIAAGKLSPVAQLGLQRSAMLLRFPLIAIHLSALGFAAFRCIPVSAALLTLAALPKAFQLDSFVRSMRFDENRIGWAKFYAVRWHAAFGLLLAIGVALPHATSTFGFDPVVWK